MAPQSSEVDVLIVGAGPAGLMLATWLSKLKISTRIIDKRNTKVFTGQADGVQCRTVEVFQSFGFAERLVKEGAHINEVAHWEPKEGGGIQRTKRTPDNEPGTSRFPHAVLTQGRIERFMLDAMREFNDLEVHRSIQPTSLSIDPSLVSDFTSHAISVTLRHLSEEEATPTQVGTVANGLFRSNLLTDEEADANPPPNANGDVGKEEIVKAKFVVGCDGARSWVRKQLDLHLEGDSANTYWGVLDALVITDFPDIRLKCTMHSHDAGSILIVPRERDLVRLYVQLGHTEEGERVDRTKVTPESILATAQRIMAPYKIETPYVEWFTCYEIGQRICPKVTLDERVFIAGDAFHTHSPKAGQGMNVSMMDTYNLGWKLAHVLQGKADTSILKTYQDERHQTAQELIDLDYRLSRMFSAKPSTGADDKTGVSLEEFEAFFKSVGKWASGTAAQYKSGVLVEKTGATDVAKGLPLGMRFESHQVVSIADARPWHIGDRLESDGRWRIIIFAGDVRIASQKAQLEKVAAYLDSPSGPLRTYTPPNADIDSVIETLTIISNPRISIEPNDFPEILWPAKGEFGCRDYHKLYADDESWFSGKGEAYKHLGIDTETGCIAVVRPDQTVSLTCRLEEHELLGEFRRGD
ncbi:FAD monooxygenase [Leucosporidium creatinivorum]|uniref:FAD monooxygenase n=1 Tax=Leucosporidium creatinivorum TaxID=106004 RepID=A0A1Y2DBP5_9BASI|nr:FAD monooxygenase [Leucosporidium creatinivorum]